MPSSPPVRAFKTFAPEEVDSFLQSDAPSPSKQDTFDFTSTNWEDFLVQSDSEQPPPPLPPPPSQGHLPEMMPHVAFTAVNSTVDSSMEFTARQVLLNAEFTPVSSPDTTRSPSARSDSTASPAADETGFEETPRAQELPPHNHRHDPRPVEMSRVLSDITAHTSSDENKLLSAPKEKRPRGRPRGWRKAKMDPNMEIILPVMTPNMFDANSSGSSTEAATEKPRGPKQSTASKEPKEEDQWSVRIRTSIKDAMLDHLVKGIIFLAKSWELTCFFRGSSSDVFLLRRYSTYKLALRNHRR